MLLPAWRQEQLVAIHRKDMEQKVRRTYAADKGAERNTSRRGESFRKE